jgi:hypothetical protein
MSVVRATTATRVNSAGLVELVPYNLFSYSEQFDNAYWSKNLVTITSNVTNAPDGTLTADKIIIDNGSQVGPAVFILSDTETSTRTLSFYAKASEYNIAFGRVGGAVSAPIVLFSLTGSGSILHNQNASSYSIESVGDGWYRCSMTYAHGTRFAPNIGVCSATYSVSASNVTSTGNGTSGIFIWGAQLNEGTILPYQKTETRLNIPRLDYSNGTCPSLLVEPQRTNSIISSQSTATGWTFTNTSSLIDQTASPDGNVNADSIIPNTTSGQHAINSTNILGIGAFTLSAFVKAGEYTKVAIRESANTGSYASFDLATGTKIEDNVSGASFIQSYGNGWYRIGVTGTFIGIIRLGINVLSNAYTTGSPSSGTTFFAGNGTDKLFCWGMQCELGATYATSYIPTTSASVTRNADVISKTGISSLIGQTEGTLFLDYLYTELDVNGNIPITIGLNGTNQAYIFFRNNGGVRFDFIVSGVATARIDTPASYSVKGTRYKIAFAYKDNDFAAYINGQLIGTDNAGAITGLSNLFLGYPYASGLNATSNINAAALWQTRLDNATLAQLTTI